jgi:hypothetical protein
MRPQPARLIFLGVSLTFVFAELYSFKHMNYKTWTTLHYESTYSSNTKAYDMSPFHLQLPNPLQLQSSSLMPKFVPSAI